MRHKCLAEPKREGRDVRRDGPVRTVQTLPGACVGCTERAGSTVVDEAWVKFQVSPPNQFSILVRGLVKTWLGMLFASCILYHRINEAE